MSSIDFTSVTGRPVDCRSWSWIVLLSRLRRRLRPHDPGDRRQADVQRVGRVRHLRLRDRTSAADGSLSSPLLLMSATMPMICRSPSPSNSRITPLPITMRSFSGSPFGQNCFAIASLMITTGVDVLGVALVERPSALHRDLEHLEVAGRHRHPAAAAVIRTLAVGRERPPDDAERQAVAALRAARSRSRSPRPRRESPSASRRRCAPPVRPLPTCRTARLSATSASSARCACRSRDRRARAPSRSG